MQPQSIIHPFPPVFDENSKSLILGSFPSVKSRESMFFYGHPQNRFWKVLAIIFNQPIPQNIEDKKNLVLDNGLALWDSIHSCTVIGSSDSSIKDVIPNDIRDIIQNSNINRIFCNGALSHKMYMKYIFPDTGIKAVKLPSTSPANATFSLEKLVEEWKMII